jgi:hypothetical protein
MGRQPSPAAGRADRRRLLLHHGSQAVEVPWPRLAGVRRDGEHLFPKLRGVDGDPQRYGPFAPAPDETEEQAAERLAATMMAVCERAGVGADDAPEVRSRRRPLGWVLRLYGLATAAALVWSWLT